jgi:hypothetical protein
VPVAAEPCPSQQAGHRQQRQRWLDQRERQQHAGRLERNEARRVKRKRRLVARCSILALQQKPRSSQGNEDEAGKLAERQVEQAGREENGGHDRRQRAALWPRKGIAGGAPAEPGAAHHRGLRQQQPDGGGQRKGEQRQRSQQQRDVARVDEAKDEGPQRLAWRSPHRLPDACIDGRRIGIGAGQQPGARAEPAREEIVGRAHCPRQQRGGDDVGGDGRGQEGGTRNAPAAAGVLPVRCCGAARAGRIV